MDIGRWRNVSLRHIPKELRPAARRGGVCWRYGRYYLRRPRAVLREHRGVVELLDGSFLFGGRFSDEELARARDVLERWHPQVEVWAEMGEG